MRLPPDESSLFRLALAIVGAITIVRLVVSVVTPLQLYPDEAQYWWWAQSLDWGYFSKPPLVAWIIWLTTRLGDPEWAIRLASPLLHAGTALVLFGIGRVTFNARIGFWSALAYATLPGISYSSGLISTDVPLLFCWAVALYAFLRALDDPRWRWPILCGVAFGVGMLAKYAMLYFVLSAIVAALLMPRARALVLSRRGAVVLLVWFLILSPNLIWNTMHGFPTFAHTEANANWGRAKFEFGNSLTFIVGQFGVFGPLMMAGWAAALWSPPCHDGEHRGACRLLMAFSAPVLVLVIVQSFISDANANWAAPAYVAAVPLAVVVLLSWWRSWALWVSLGIGVATLAGLWIVQVAPDAAFSGFSNAFKRQEGWKEMSSAVAEAAHDAPYDAITAANRSVLAELLYYARPRSAPVRAWDRSAVPHDHFQMTIPLRPGTRRVLVVTEPREAPAILALFDSPRLVSTLKIPLGKHHSRVLALYDAHNFRGPQPTR